MTDWISQTIALIISSQHKAYKLVTLVPAEAEISSGGDGHLESLDGAFGTVAMEWRRRRRSMTA